MGELKKTPLYDVYRHMKAKLIDFGGWALPVQFSSIKEEHEAVRKRAGLFDVSHMGEIEVKGPDAEIFLQKMLTNDLAKLKQNKAQYTILCYENGGTVDDLLVYKFHDDLFLLVVNAANIEKDYQWLIQHKTGKVEIQNVSGEYAQLALQGPLAEKILQKLCQEDLSQIPYFGFNNQIKIADKPALVSRTGYTGEDGFEIYCSPCNVRTIWEEILSAGKEEGVLPCGLGARDTLRFEACLPLYGQELSSTISPIEAGLTFAVKPKKKDGFIGQSVLKEQIEKGAIRKLIGIEMIERGIPRMGYKVYQNGKEIGKITTGTQSLTLKKNIGLALVESDKAEIGSELIVEIRNKKVLGRVVSTPFYRRKK
jgi:aminomethyltransferase